MSLTAATASLIGAGLSAAATVGTGFINQGMNKRQFNRATAWNEKMYERQLADQRKLINEQRIYESPAQQLARIREAGLNPNLLSGAFGGPSSAPMQPVSAGSAPSIGSNPMPDIGSSISSGFNQFASGIDTSNLTQMKLLKGQAELDKLKTETDYQKIVNEFAEAKENMTLAKGQQDINESLARIKEYASKVSLSNSQIEVNGHQIKLIDKNADLAAQNQQLAAAKTFLTNLDSQKLIKLMPYLEAQAESEYYLTRAKGDAALMAANLSYEQASLASVQAMKELELLDAGYADVLVNDLKSQANYRTEDAKYIKRRANTQAWQVGATYLQSLGTIALSAAGIYLGAVAKVKPVSSIYTSNGTNYGGVSWKYQK